MAISSLSHPVLILIRGLPGSGKSYLAEALRDEIGPEHVLILDPDAIDKNSRAYIDHSQALADEGVEEKFFPHRFLRSHAFQAIEANKVIIWTQAFTLLDGFKRTVHSLQEHAAEHNTTLPLLVVEVNVSPEAAKKRAAEREKQTGRSVSEEAFARFVRDYVSFADQGHHTITVDGEADIHTSVATVMDALKDAL